VSVPLFLVFGVFGLRGDDALKVGFYGLDVFVGAYCKLVLFVVFCVL
jgi:hypothetical protein